MAVPVPHAALRGLPYTTGVKISGERGSPVASPKKPMNSVLDNLQYTKGPVLISGIGQKSPTTSPKSNGPAPDPTLLESGIKLWVPPTKGGKGKKNSKTRTSQKVTIQGKERTVYLGPKGGKYIKTKSGFKAI